MGTGQLVPFLPRQHSCLSRGWGRGDFALLGEQSPMPLGPPSPSELWFKLTCAKTPARGHLSCLPSSQQGRESEWSCLPVPDEEGRPRQRVRGGGKIRPTCRRGGAKASKLAYSKAAGGGGGSVSGLSHCQHGQDT